MTGHDIVVMGGSAGGVESVRTLVAGLPADLRTHHGHRPTIDPLFHPVVEPPETALFSEIDDAGAAVDRRDRTQPVSGGERETAPDE